MENGYVGKDGIIGPRRSTGQSYPDRELGRQHGARPSIFNAELSSSNGSGEEDGRLIRRGEVHRNGGNVSRKVSMEEEELADGWPKWLLDNVPKKVLAGLVPKSADSYDKLDKVCTVLL